MFTVDTNLLDLDFLIYSSHKTATQTIVGSLNLNGLRARHCHNVGNIGLKHSEFTAYLDMYKSRNAKNLKVISVFRDPMERLISSFFQWYGTRPIKQGEVRSEAETLILSKSIPELQTIFIEECCENSEVPIFESIDGICEQLALNCSDLTFSEESATGVNHLENCSLYLFRFDLLVQDFIGLLSPTAGRKIELAERNIGSKKFYAGQHRQFKKTLRVPENTIRRLYESRRSLLDLFYPGGYQETLDRVVHRFGRSNGF